LLKKRGKGEMEILVKGDEREVMSSHGVITQLIFYLNFLNLSFFVFVFLNMFFFFVNLRFRRGYFDLSINKEKKVVDTCESCVGT
jgi:hypothetical protein